MSDEPVEVFVVCTKEAISPGHARAFSLFRKDSDGGQRPFRVVIVRTSAHSYVGYVNACPHQGSWLNVGDGEFLTPDRKQLRCGRHGATFDIASGTCFSGPCAGTALEPIALTVIGRDVCIAGVELVEDDALPDDADEFENTLEITIHPG